MNKRFAIYVRFNEKEAHEPVTSEDKIEDVISHFKERKAKYKGLSFVVLDTLKSELLNNAAIQKHLKKK